MDLLDWDNETALIWAAENNNTELALALISGAANPNLQDCSEKTALIWAAENNNTDEGLTLIKKGANQNLQDEVGKTALDHAKTQEMYYICYEFLSTISYHNLNSKCM